MSKQLSLIFCLYISKHTKFCYVDNAKILYFIKFSFWKARKLDLWLKSCLNLAYNWFCIYTCGHKSPKKTSFFEIKVLKPLFSTNLVKAKEKGSQNQAKNHINLNIIFTSRPISDR